MYLRGDLRNGTYAKSAKMNFEVVTVYNVDEYPTNI